MEPIKHAWDVALRITVYAEDREQATETIENLMAGDEVDDWSITFISPTKIYHA